MKRKITSEQIMEKLLTNTDEGFQLRVKNMEKELYQLNWIDFMVFASAIQNIMKTAQPV